MDINRIIAKHVRGDSKTFGDFQTSSTVDDISQVKVNQLMEILNFVPSRKLICERIIDLIGQSYHERVMRASFEVEVKGFRFYNGDILHSWLNEKGQININIAVDEDHKFMWTLGEMNTLSAFLYNPDVWYELERLYSNTKWKEVSPY